MAEREAQGDFDYLFDGPTDEASKGEQADAEHWDGFDAFDTNTWYFEPAPTPWYKTRQAVLGLTATAAAASAIVVSGVLLVFSGSGGSAVEDSRGGEPRVTPTAPSTPAPTRLATSASPPPPAPPPPPPPAEASPIERAPAPTRTRSPSRTTKEPEIGVTRTPATRSPISVAPQRPPSQR